MMNTSLEHLTIGGKKNQPAEKEKLPDTLVSFKRRLSETDKHEELKQEQANVKIEDILNNVYNTSAQNLEVSGVQYSR